MKRFAPLLLLLAACATVPREPRTLVERAAVLLKAAENNGSLVSVYVVDAKNGEVLFAHREHARTNSASTMKLASTTAALTILGPDYRFQTPIALQGKLKNDLFEGDLVISASGDPSFGSRIFPSTDRLPRIIAQALQAKGIKRWRGNIRVEGAEVDTPDLYGPGWAWDDMAHDYSARPSRFAFHDNVARLLAKRSKGSAGCGPISIRLEPPLRKPNVIVKAVDSANLGDLECLRHPTTGDVQCNWPLPPDRCPQRDAEWITVDDPVALFEASLLQALQDVGISRLAGAVPSSEATAEPLLTVESPPLSELVRVTNKESLNLYAERLALAATKVKTGEESYKALATTFEMDHAARGIPPADFQQVDGSGLSRYNFVSAFGLVQLLRSAMGTSYEEALLMSLPITGLDGTLRSHKLQEPARAWAKTGTLTGQRGFAGFIERPDDAQHPTLIFALLVGNTQMSRAETNALVDRLAEIVTLAPLL